MPEEQPRPTVSLDEASALFANRLYAEPWFAASEDDRRKALEWASRLISGAFLFSTSAFRTDSSGAVVWSERVSIAVCEEALWLLKRDPTEIPELLTLGVASASVASLSATLDRSFVAPLICDAAKRAIGNLGEFVAIVEGGTCASTPLAI
ncbi:MAG: hypothetical protein IJM30_04685 [Thermoguttaceae bacterium]|nr:hypothetical protein [Thermoguttaceae bacterium]